MKSFAINGYKNFIKQTPYEWLYNPIIEMNAIGNIIETLGNIIKMLKYLPQSLSVFVTI